MTRSSRWLLALLAAMSLVASACASGEDDAATRGGGDAAGSDQPIVIGGTLGLTGTYSGPSAGYKVAYDYWLEQINENGGMLGRPVEMKIYDDESNPTTAQQLYQTLINEDQVDLLLAPYTTAVGGAVVPITERAGKTPKLRRTSRRPCGGGTCRRTRRVPYHGAPAEKRIEPTRGSAHGQFVTTSCPAPTGSAAMPAR